MRKTRRYKSFKFMFIIFIISCLLMAFIYEMDKVVKPTLIAAADAEMRSKSIEIISESILEEFSKNFKYDEVIEVDKDSQGNISMLKADTLKMNRIACDVAIKSQQKLSELGSIGVKIPIGYILQNNFLASFGPNLTVKMQPIGSIETKYSSDFESAGINQTRHKIYVKVNTRVKVILPFDSNILEVNNEIPIAETIIVGKVPDNAINLDLQSAGYKMKNRN